MSENEDKICDNCSGEGFIIGSKIDPQCCGNFDRLDQCCGNAIPVEVPEQYPCEKCQTSGKIKN